MNRLKFRDILLKGNSVQNLCFDTKLKLERWLQSAQVENVADLKDLIIKEQLYNSLPYSLKTIYTEQRLYEKNMDECIKILQPYVERRKEKGNGNINLTCHHCKKPGHFKSQCFLYKKLEESKKAKQIHRNNKKIFFTKEIENDEESEDEKSEEEKCLLANQDLPIVHGKVNNKPANFIRDTGCTTVLVKKNLIPKNAYDGGSTTLSFADGKK